MVSLAATSDPPIRSVIHWPDVQARAGSRAVRRGSARAARSACPETKRGFAAPSGIASGQEVTPEEGSKRRASANTWRRGRGLEKVEGAKLREAREGAVPPFVWKGDEALLGRDPERLLPEARQLDPVDAASPRVPRGQDGDRRLVLPEKLVERPAREGPHLPERRLDLPEDLGREVVFEEGAENGVALVRVAKGRGSLDEGHGVAHVIPLFNDIAFTLSESRPPRASAVPP